MSILDSVRFITPEIVLFVSSILILLLSLRTNDSFGSVSQGARSLLGPGTLRNGPTPRRSNLLGAIALSAVVASSLLLPFGLKANQANFFNLLTGDAFSLFFKEICLFTTGIVVLISMGYEALNPKRIGEYYFLLLNAAIAMLLAVSSNNLLMIYISLEMLSLVSYILVAFLKHDELSSEGALKYFLFGALSTGIMLYGISLVYGLFGTTDLHLIWVSLQTGHVNPVVTIILLIFILAGIAFKCSLVPFHMWVPDAYQGAPTAITAFISVGSKAVGFAVLMRIFSNIFFPLHINWTHLVVGISIFTMTAGNLIAISQTNIKRMLAYSSIAQAGYILIGFCVGRAAGIEGALYYLLAYALMNLGAFGCVILVSNYTKTDAIEDYSGLYRRDPYTAFILSVFLLSLAGVPPLAGFLGKFLVFSAAIEARFILLAVAGIINSVIAAYYYIRVIKYMYLDEPKGVTAGPKSVALQAALVVVLIGVLIAGIYPSPFLAWIKASQSFLLP